MNCFFLFAFLCLVTFAQAQTTSKPSSDIDPKLPTLWIIGDSTVRNGGKDQMGWGDPIKELFDRSKINVVNRAIGGRSSRTFRTDGRWEQILNEAKAGDFVIMQFGHNDASPLSEDNRERGTIRGIGDESKEVTLTLKEGKKETVYSFGWYMKSYITEAKEKGMQSVVCSPIPRAPSTQPSTKPAEAEPQKPRELSGYSLWAKQSADAAGATFIDLNGIISSKYAKLPPQEVKQKYFCPTDNTHTSPAGAQLNAECVVEGLKASDSPLKQFLKSK